MNTKLVKRWDESNAKLSIDKQESAYAIAVELDFPRNAKILDLGGGTGADMIYFLQKGHSGTLVDISELALQRAQDSATKLNLENNLTTEQIDLIESNLPFADNSFDIVYSRLTLHYLLPERAIDIFREIKRILKENGKAFITIKSQNDKKEMEFLRQNSQEVAPNVFVKNDEVKSIYSPEQVDEMLKKAGVNNFKIDQYTEDMSGKNDLVASGNMKLVLTQIKFTK